MVIYDVGACSYRVGWELLATVLPIYVNRYLADLGSAEPLTPAEFTITPRISAEPASAALPLGPLTMTNELTAHLEFTTPSIAGCPDQRLTADAGLRIVEVPARIQMPEEQAIDAAVVATVGCTPTMQSNVYDCTWFSVDDDANTVTFWSNTLVYYYGMDPELMAAVGCVLGPTTYECLLPPPDAPGGGAGINANIRATYDRPFTMVDHAVDINLELVGISANLNDPCVGDWFINGVVEGAVRRAVAGVSSQLNAQIVGALGTTLDPDFGVPTSELRACTTDWDCREIPYFGGRRHSCIAGLCNGAHIEVRRVHVRPDGLEFVLAEGIDDPQYDLLENVSGLIAPDGALEGLLGTFGEDPDVCHPGRWAVESSDPPAGLAIVPTGPIIPSLLNSPICDTTNPDCAGICTEVGVTCDQAIEFEIPGAGNREIPAGSTRCVNGICQPDPSP
jgi:hypothetical protein